MKLLIVVGTRPEIIKLSRIIVNLDKKFDLTLLHTGQNFDYELDKIFFKELEIREPDVNLDINSNSSTDFIGKLLSKMSNFLQKNKFDASLVLGDTNSALCTLALKKFKIPIFHMEAGNRCFDNRVPEEINRKLIDQLSDINLTYTKIAKQNLLLEGFHPSKIIVSGSPMREVINFYEKKIKKSSILNKLNLKPKKYFVFSSHREENVDNDKCVNEILIILNNLAHEYGLPIIFSVHPRTFKSLKSSIDHLNKLIRYSKPFGLFDYLQLQKNSFCTISDSGTLTEEADILKFNSINLRNVNERPEGFENATTMITGVSWKNVKLALKEITNDRNYIKVKNDIEDYKNDKISTIIARTIISYTQVINRDIKS